MGKIWFIDQNPGRDWSKSRKGLKVIFHFHHFPSSIPRPPSCRVVISEQCSRSRELKQEAQEAREEEEQLEPAAILLASVAIWRYFIQLSSHFYGLRPPLFVVTKGHNIWKVILYDPLCGLRSPQFVVAEGHTNWEVTDDGAILTILLLA